MHQVAVTGKTLRVIVLHVARSVKQSRQHGQLDHWLRGFAKLPLMPLIRGILLMKLFVYRSRNNKIDVKLIESQSNIKVN